MKETEGWTEPKNLFKKEEIKFNTQLLVKYALEKGEELYIEYCKVIHYE